MPIKNQQRAVFLDRDGVINVDHAFVHRAEDFQFIDDVFSALQSLQTRGYLLIVVTNQSGIGRGYYSQQDFETLNRWMISELALRGIEITAVYHCPHAPDETCECRKPAPGMFLRAAAEWDLQMEHCWMIGDKLSDRDAAVAAGVGNTALVKTGQFQGDAATARPATVCDSLADVLPLLDAQAEAFSQNALTR